MNRVDGFSAYQNSYYDMVLSGRKEQEAVKTAQTRQAEENSQVKLSDNAKKLLEELKKTYGNMDFMVADYETEEEAASYLSRGTKEYSVLLDPETLEEMAADEDTKAKYLNQLDEATGKLTEMKDQLGDDADEVTHLGVSIDKDGSVSYFAELEKVNEKQTERIEKARENRKEEKANAEKVAEKSKRTRVSADSVEGLLEKIRNIDWSQIKEEKVATSGSRFDFSI